MDENKFWITVWSIAGMCLVVIVLSISVCCMYEKRILAKALTENPQRSAMDVVCGLNQGSPDICAIRAAK